MGKFIGSTEADAEMDATAPITKDFSEDRSKWKGQRPSKNVLDLQSGTLGGKIYDALAFGSLDELKQIADADVKPLTRAEREHLIAVAQAEIKETLRNRTKDTAPAFRAYQNIIKRLR